MQLTPDQIGDYRAAVLIFALLTLILGFLEFRAADRDVNGEDK